MTESTHTAAALPPALVPLVADRRWLVWKWEPNKKGKSTKVPYRADAPNVKGSSTDRRTWSDYATAVRAVEAGRADGIGYALHGGEVAAFDLDNCRDRETHEIAPWALKLLERAQSYAEVTPSGEGIRIIGRAIGDEVHRRQRVPMTTDGAVETFRRAGRFITVTGDVLLDAPEALAQLDEVIDETVAALDEAKRAEKVAERGACREAEQEVTRQSKGERTADGAGSQIYGGYDSLPRELYKLIRFGPGAGSDRSAAFHHAVCWLKDYGWSVDKIEALMAAHPRGVAEKYEGRLRAEIERSWDKGDAPRQTGREQRQERRQEKREEPTAIPLHWHREAQSEAERTWLVRDLLSTEGKGLLSGQWGSAKTFIALDLSGCIMTGEPFAGRRVLRRGGVLFIAPEGAFEIPIRLKGLVAGKLAGTVLAQKVTGMPTVNPNDLPFAWIEECPRLVDRDATDQLTLTAGVAAAELRERYDLPLALIIVDTVAAGAGFDDENSAAETQKVMNALGRLSQHTGAFVLGVDHFGKVAETGTRGSSAKEAAADTVLAALASRDEAGNVSNLRLAVRKVRGAPTGMETPYTLEVVEVGEDEWGEPITTCVVNWQTNRVSEAAVIGGRERWPTSLRVFRQAMNTALDEHGIRAWPYGGSGPEHRAVPLQKVRGAFYAIYPADADDEVKRREAKRKAFKRALDDSTKRELIGSIELKGVDHLWLKPDPHNRDTHTGRTGHS
ncbi:conserved hypothetical protein [Methylobacterium sp. 4-46]|uniref:AAA family ATPase n=1 Tax=unclassified Methylobacterium TaxID=2615210 RepID=UPI000152BEFF|nr:MULTISPECIES: AAA family ATPase [Methylobacterium]ACA18345.1 conserved hypothetical protein [Methylobacterium sp. 4-46]WFT77641.1 AAA family ATPase [Methylobacterium nodulans]